MSKYWTYFMKMPALQAQCNLCMKVVKTGGSTTNLRNHLRCKHKEHLDLLDYIAYQNTTNDSQLKLHDIPIVDENADMTIEETQEEASETVDPFSRSSSPARSDSSDSSEDSAQRIDDPTSWKKGGLLYERTTNAVLYMICVDNYPHVMVEMPGFRRFSKTAQPLYQLPSGDEILKLIAARYKLVKSQIVIKMKGIEHVSLSCRIFTVKKRNFMVIAAHFICPAKKKPEKLVLGIRWLNSTYTHDDVSNAIQFILNDFELPDAKITSVCIDDTSVILKAAIEQLFGKEKCVPCVAHLLHSMLNDAIGDENNPTLRGIINEVETAVKYIDQSFTRFLDQSLLTEEEAEDVLKLVGCMDDVSLPTSRNSVYYMICSFLRLLPCLQRALKNGRFKNVPEALRDPNIDVLNEISQILALFDEATNELSVNGYLTGSVIAPLISCVVSGLADIPLVFDVAKKLCQSLGQSLTGAQGNLMNPLFCQASFCDPRFKKMYTPLANADDVVEKCCAEVKEKLEKRSDAIEDPINVTALWKFHDENVAKERKTDGEMPYEFQVYLEQMPLPRTADPYQFWLQNRGCMPSLSSIALKNLTTCSSSISTDELAKVLKKIFSDDRFCWVEEHVNQRVFLNQLDEEYWVNADENSGRN